MTVKIQFPDEFAKIKEEFERLKSDNVFQQTHRQSRFLLYKFLDDEISKHLYKWLCDNCFVDKDLTIYWLKPGYENLCCTICVSKHFTDKVCICRVPKKSLDSQLDLECKICQCTGCSG